MAGLQGLVVRAVGSSQGRHEEVPCNYDCLSINTCGFFWHIIAVSGLQRQVVTVAMSWRNDFK